MKLTKITTLFTLCATLVMTSCMNEDIRVNQNEAGDGVKGYLSLAGLNVECVADHRQSDNAGLDTSSTRATRADADINTFDCEIINSLGQVVNSFKYGERPQTPIELDKGNYLFRMQSGEIPGAAWENPVYGHTEPFTIHGKETTTLSDLVCKLLNIQVTVTFSEDLSACLSDDTTTKVTLKENSLLFAKNETRSGYLLAPSTSNELEVLVKGEYTPEGKTQASPFEMNATIHNVKPGQYSDIKLYVEYSDEGTIVIKATIDCWVVDDELLCDYSVQLNEMVIPDDDDLPKIIWRDYDIANPLTLTSDMFDEYGKFLSNLYIDIKAEKLIESLTVDISSSNAEMMASLADYNLPQSFDLCNAGVAGAALRLMGYPINDALKGQSEATFNLAGQMGMLYEYTGTHTFHVTVTDAAGNSNSADIVLVVPGAEVGPSIVWVGHDINKRYYMSPGLTVDIVVTSDVGIKEFIVCIVSDTLTPQELEGVQLCDNLNLGSPLDSFDSRGIYTDMTTVEPALRNLGFPTSGDVVNQNTVAFSITNFLDLLAFTGKGNHDFIMTVTDNDGNTTVKTLMLTNKD